MKAKTKLQIRVVELSKGVPTITDKQIQWANQHCFEHLAFYTKAGGATCMECGQNFDSGDMSLLINSIDPYRVCPHCGQKVKVIQTKKRKLVISEYMCILHPVKELQLIRFITVDQYYHKGKPANYANCEVVNHYVTGKGKWETFSKLRSQNFGGYVDCWSWTSDFDLRVCKYHHNVSTKFIYPEKKYILELKRNGFKGNFHGFNPLDMFVDLLSCSQFETLFKAKQIGLFKNFASSDYKKLKLNLYWPSIKICIRKNYFPADANIWTDYIDLLSYFRKDLSNAKYVCPENLHKEHDRLVTKKRTIQQKEELELKKLKAAEQEADFKALKAKFFGLRFTDGLIVIKVLDSVREYVEEGDKLHHCVFTNNYYSRTDSLILSARIEDEPVETIEVSLKDFKVVQSRGLRNSNTEYHERIISLVNENVMHIKRRKNRKFTA